MLLDRLVPPAHDSYGGTVGDVFNRPARLGGYLNRRHDGPLGHTVLWRGLTRLADIQLGSDLDHSYGKLKASTDGNSSSISRSLVAQCSPVPSLEMIRNIFTIP